MRYLKHLSLLSFSAVASLLLTACNERYEADEAENMNSELSVEHRSAIEYRASKDDFFRGEKSPLLPEEKSEFQGLSWFDYDESYRVVGTVTRQDSLQRVTLGTSTGEPREMLVFGTWRGDLRGESVELTLYRTSQAVDHLFIPFMDRTSGSESYKAGRYLDVPVPEGDSMAIDFNYAYSPLCAYNEAYSCPLVPSENRLAVAIRAGEKRYQ